MCTALVPRHCAVASSTARRVRNDATDLLYRAGDDEHVLTRHPSGLLCSSQVVFLSLRFSVCLGPVYLRNAAVRPTNALQDDV